MLVIGRNASNHFYFVGIIDADLNQSLSTELKTLKESFNCVVLVKRKATN